MSPVLRVALLVFIVAALGAGAYLLFHKSPKVMSGVQGRLIAERRRHAVQVPDVRNQTLVEAKGAFDQAGLAWEVVGPVKGYHTNVVVAETPAAGTRLIDTGMPLVKLRLKSAGGETGAPENHSSAPGTAVQVLGAPATGVTTSAAPAVSTRRTTTAPHTVTTVRTTTPAHTTQTLATTHTATTHAATTHAATTAAPPVRTHPATTTAATGEPALSSRPPAFILPGGAHRERVGELPLPTRAQLLVTYLRAHKKLTKKVAHHWLVQHAWVVDGARFGWWHGAEALNTLISADRLAEARWGVGYANEEIARQALAYVHAHEAAR